MNLFFLIVSLLTVGIACTLYAAWLDSRPRGGKLVALGNVGEGFQPAVKTYLTDAAFASRNLCVKIGSAADHVALCGVGDIPLGLALDEASAAEGDVAVARFGLHRDGALGVASGAIAAGDYLVPGANGTLRTLPVAAGTYHIVGRAEKAAANTDPVEFIPCFPIQRIVT